MENKFTTAYLKNSWMWGKPEGLSDHPEEFLAFLLETESIQYIAATGVIRINNIDEEDALQLISFLRYPPIVRRKVIDQE